MRSILTPLCVIAAAVTFGLAVPHADTLKAQSVEELQALLNIIGAPAGGVVGAPAGGSTVGSPATTTPPPPPPMGGAAGTTVVPGITSYGQIYSRSDIPHAWYSQGTPFQNILYLSDGYFAVSGTCSPKLSSSYSPIEVSQMKPQARSRNKWLQGGLYVFKESGDFVGMRDVCYDGDIPGAGDPLNPIYGCNEIGGCEGSVVMLPLSGDSFVRELISKGILGWNRPPIQYRITDTGIVRVSKAYQGKRLWTDASAGAVAGQTHMLGNLVLAAGKLVGFKSTYEGSGTGFFSGQQHDGRTGNSNVVLSTNGFSLLREWDVPTPPRTSNQSGEFDPTNEAEITPLAGVADLVVGAKFPGTYSTAPTARVYRLDDDDKLVELQTLPGFTGNYSAYQIDTANSNRIGFIGSATRGTFTVDTYTATTTGLTLEKSTVLPGFHGAVYYGNPGFALMGDYIVYRGYSGGSNAENARVHVLKNGATLAEFALPRVNDQLVPAANGSFADMPMSFALSPKGDLFVGSSYGYLYHYKINEIAGIANPTGPGGGPVTIQPGGTAVADVQGYLNFASSYLQILSTFLTPNSGTLSSEGAGNPALIDAYNQAYQLISGQ